MKANGVDFEDGEFGKRAVLTSPWSTKAHHEILRKKPEELELNTSKGWSGDQINFLADFDWLKSIIIIDLKIRDVGPIHALSNLLNLEVITYCKSGIHFSSFPSLQSCALEWRPKAQSIFDCATLRKLFLNRYSGKSSEPFGQLLGLEDLTILNSPVSEIHNLGGLRHLQSLRLGNLRLLPSLEGLERLHNLKYLEVQSCRSIRSLEPLSNLENLEILNISNNKELDSLSPLKGLPNLHTVLFYESTNIVDGDLNPIFLNKNVSLVAFQNRRHYSHKREEFTIREQE